LHSWWEVVRLPSSSCWCAWPAWDRKKQNHAERGSPEEEKERKKGAWRRRRRKREKMLHLSREVALPSASPLPTNKDHFFLLHHLHLFFYFSSVFLLLPTRRRHSPTLSPSRPVVPIQEEPKTKKKRKKKEEGENRRDRGGSIPFPLWWRVRCGAPWWASEIETLERSSPTFLAVAIITLAAPRPSSRDAPPLHLPPRPNDPPDGLSHDQEEEKTKKEGPPFVDHPYPFSLVDEWHLAVFPTTTIASVWCYATCPTPLAASSARVGSPLLLFPGGEASPPLRFRLRESLFLFRGPVVVVVGRRIGSHFWNAIYLRGGEGVLPSSWSSSCALPPSPPPFRPSFLPRWGRSHAHQLVASGEGARCRGRRGPRPEGEESRMSPPPPPPPPPSRSSLSTRERSAGGAPTAAPAGGGSREKDVGTTLARPAIAVGPPSFLLQSAHTSRFLLFFA